MLIQDDIDSAELLMGMMEADSDNGDGENCALHAYYDELMKDITDWLLFLIVVVWCISHCMSTFIKYMLYCPINSVGNLKAEGVHI